MKHLVRWAQQDLNLRPLGEQRGTDHDRHGPSDLQVLPVTADHNRHRPTGFSDGKVTADHGRPLIRRVLAAIGFLAALPLTVTIGSIGRLMLDYHYDLLAWIWTGSWVGIVACGCWYWCDRANRRRDHR